MGKHSSNRQWPFYRSLVAWLIPWLLLTMIVVGASWATVRAIGGDEIDTPPPARRPTATVPAVQPSPTPKAEEPSPDATETAKKKQSDQKKKGKPELITDGISVQVLNATATTGAARTMAARLMRLGFRVVAVDRASVAYERTTVFWSSSEARPAARALARRFGWKSDPKPRNLSATVSLHVIVGLDEV